jgi:hypothetical protein
MWTLLRESTGRRLVVALALVMAAASACVVAPPSITSPDSLPGGPPDSTPLDPPTSHSLPVGTPGNPPPSSQPVSSESPTTGVSAAISRVEPCEWRAPDQGEIVGYGLMVTATSTATDLKRWEFRAVAGDHGAVREVGPAGSTIATATLVGLRLGVRYELGVRVGDPDWGTWSDPIEFTIDRALRPC